MNKKLRLEVLWGGKARNFCANIPQNGKEKLTRAGERPKKFVINLIFSHAAFTDRILVTRVRSQDNEDGVDGPRGNHGNASKQDIQDYDAHCEYQILFRQLTAITLPH